MFPNSLAGIAIFLFFALPGALWEARIRRRRPAISLSAAREVATVALWSLVFSVAAAVLVVGVAEVLLPDRLQEFDNWLRQDSSTTDTLVVAVFGLAQFSTSLLLVLLADAVFGERLYGSSVLKDESAWTAAFKTNRPAGSRPFVIARLQDGDGYSGLIEQYTADLPVADRELTLVEPIARIVTGSKPELLTDARRVVLQGDQLVALEIQYLPQMEVDTLNAALAAERVKSE